MCKLLFFLLGVSVAQKWNKIYYLLNIGYFYCIEKGLKLQQKMHSPPVCLLQPKQVGGRSG